MQHIVTTILILTYFSFYGFANHHNSHSYNTFYLKKIIGKYSEGDHLSLDGFLTMMNGSSTGCYLSVNRSVADNYFDGAIQAREKDADSEPNEQCLPHDVFFHLITGKDTSTLEYHVLEENCCVLLYHMLARSPFERENCCINVPLPKDSHDEEAHVWIGAITSMVIINLLGFLANLMVPFRKYKFFSPMLQLLVSLSGGTLIGDACIHLFPHAFSDGNGSTHFANCMKGLFASLSIISYSFFRKAYIIFNSYMYGKKHQDEPPPSMKVTFTEGKVILPLAENRSSSTEETENNPLGNSENTIHHENTTYTNSDDITNKRERQHMHMDGSSKKHSNLNEETANIWMPILGNAAHNWADGVAIGAAFSVSVQSGLSTAITVMIHEIPYELGDFAVLLKSGISLKEAVVYSTLSFISGLFGIIVGVLLGRIEGVSKSLCSMSGGLFLYIALIDMIPELSLYHPSISATNMLLIQTAGLLSGVLLMFVISVYEYVLADVLS